MPGTCFGEASIFHVSFEGKPGLAGFDRPRKHSLYQLLRCALLNNGVDCAAHHGWISAMHDEADLRAHRAGLRARVPGPGRRRRVQGDVMRRRAALAALALLLGGCVHYPTVEDIGGVRIRTENGKAVRQGDGVVVYFDVVSTGKFGDIDRQRRRPGGPRRPGSSTPAARRSPQLEVPGATTMKFAADGPHIVLDRSAPAR